MQDVREIPIGQIVPDPDQPRKHFDAVKLLRLGNSMKAEGQLQDAEGHVDPNNPENIILTDGERRYLASVKVGLPILRVRIVEPANAGNKLMRQLLLNTGEQNTTMEKVNAYRRAIDELGMSCAEVAEAHGVSVELVERDLPLANLTETVQKAVDDGTITKEVARKISGLPKDKHHPAYTKAIAGKSGKAQLQKVNAYINAVNQQKLYDDQGVPADQAHESGQKLVSLMKTFTKMSTEGHINGRLNSAVKSRSRRIPEFKELAKSIRRFSDCLENTCLAYEAAAEQTPAPEDTASNG